MKAIMYHYVRPFDSSLPYLKSLHLDDFRKQLDYFEAEYGFVDYAQFIQSIYTGLSPDGVVLTFDDGLSCHYEYVYKELKSRGLWGVFYISAKPFTDRCMLDVHRTHILLGRHRPEVVYDFLMSNITDCMIDKGKLNEFDLIVYGRQENDDKTLRIKKMMNYFVAYEYRNEILNKLMAQFVPDENMLAEQYYLNSEQIKEMRDNGMLIGSHTITHPVMSRLSVSEQAEEITGSFGFLETVLSELPCRTFCYPYGGFHSFTSETEQLLDDAGCLFSFNVEQRDISGSDLKKRPQALPRYDCNQFPYGQIRV